MKKIRFQDKIINLIKMIKNKLIPATVNLLILDLIF
jgi:hypothetical protein